MWRKRGREGREEEATFRINCTARKMSKPFLSSVLACCTDRESSVTVGNVLELR